MRRRASKRKFEGSDEDVLSWHVHICSVNNFPTAAGLASSAAGYACLGMLFFIYLKTMILIIMWLVQLVACCLRILVDNGSSPRQGL